MPWRRSDPIRPEPRGDTSRAAQYLRMSTEHQKYSTENQADTNLRYAEQHLLRIVRTYEDGGKSGLRLKGRTDLQKLLADVRSGDCDFYHILVYDVSRWGRFQDIDESAHYEFICKEAGLEIHYCAEQFVNDGSFLSTLAKNLKRAMAAEYSRELSVKVFNGQCRLVRYGYYPGGILPLGLRRLLIDEKGLPRLVLEKRECKNIRSDRVILVPGPPEEIALVRKIFELFVNQKKSEHSIAKILNANAKFRKFGRKWYATNVQRTLENEKYIGNNIYNRSSDKLSQQRIQNPPEVWVRADSSFKPIVRKEIFLQAQRMIAERRKLKSDESVLAELRALLVKRGRLNTQIIDDAKLTLTAHGYHYRFRTFSNLYRLIGYTPDINRRYDDNYLLKHLRGVLAKEGRITQRLVTRRKGPSHQAYHRHFGGMRKAYELIGYDPAKSTGK